MQIRSFTIYCLLFAAWACKAESDKRPLITLDKDDQAVTTVLVTGLTDAKAAKDLRSEAESLGLEVSGKAVLSISGPVANLRRLEVESGSTATATEDAPVVAVAENDRIEADQQIFYLAKKDFDLPRYWQDHPEHDGRGVIVGVIDDGVSPILNGLQVTSTGERKYLKHRSNSSLFRIALTPTAVDAPAGAFLSTWQGPTYDSALQGVLDENKGSLYESRLDINLNYSKTDEISVAALKVAGSWKVCVDVNLNTAIDSTECFGTFAETGEYGSWTADGLNAIQAEVFPDTNEVYLRPGESPDNYDGHGEGVASVLTGYRIGGHFDGVAPGARLLDYDISVPTAAINEDTYTIGTFIKALEWMGENGANVCNISYSLFFSTAASQKFMHDALAEVIKTYNMVVSFSAGNNGPGLGSFNRGLIYPASALVAGAFVSRDLDEYVHGVTGLPEPGRVVYYSSRGPAPDFGTAPVVISPLASVTHDSPQGGFGAFSGTSSASPALAGLATVLISAIKAEQLPYEAAAVVAAIRQSAVPLEGVPYIDQGAGLPKIHAAVAAYKKIIAGTEPLTVKSQVNQRGLDGVTARGIMLRTSEQTSDLEFSVKTSVGFSQSVSPADAANKVIPVTVTYSASWISGPAYSFLNTSPSNMNVRVDLPALLSSLTSRGRDHTAEIVFHNSQTGQILHKVPVTVLDDVSVLATPLFTADLAPEDGVRFHVDVPAGVKGFTVKATNLTGGNSRVAMIVYDTNMVRTYSSSTLDGRTIVVAADKPGWYQVTLARPGGTAAASRYQLQVDPLRLTLKQEVLDDFASVEIENKGRVAEMNLTATVKPELVSSKIIRSGLGWFSQDIPVTASGAYTVNVSTPGAIDVNYPMFTCDIWLKDRTSGERLRRVDIAWSPRFNVNVTDIDVGQGDITFDCMPFESSSRSFGTAEYKIEIFRNNPADGEFSKKMPVQIMPGVTRLNLSSLGLPIGRTYELRLEPLFSTDGKGFLLGPITVL